MSVKVVHMEEHLQCSYRHEINKINKNYKYSTRKINNYKLGMLDKKKANPIGVDFLNIN